MIWTTELPAFVPFYIAAIVGAFLPRTARLGLFLLVPVISGIQLLGVSSGISVSYPFLDYELLPYRTDKLSLLFGYLFHIAAFLAVLFSLQSRKLSEHLMAMIYPGSALGAVFAGDLLTLFVFWEMLALSSVFFIWARQTPGAIQSGMRYLIFQVLSGVLLLAGALIHIGNTGSVVFEYIGLSGMSGWLIFIALGIKSAFPFVHTWLTDSYPEGTPWGTVFLSSFTTKVAIYALARAYPGTEILLYIGAAMACFPIFFAVIENDLRRVLAYSMINQVGFMVVGIGIGTELALNGAVAHAFNDVIFKGLLMMTMGAVLYRTGKINGSELGGLYKSMPYTATLCIVGAASISAFPLFSGFVSKSLVVSEAIHQGHTWLWLMLLFAAAGVFHHAGIKIPYFAFFAHDSGIRVKEAPTNMLIAMTIAAVLCILIGCFPQYLYAILPYEMDYTPYDATHVLTQMQLLFFSALAFVWLNLKNLYPPELPSTNLDVDWFYRRLFPNMARSVARSVVAADNAFRQASLNSINRLLNVLNNAHNESGVLSRTWPTGSMVMWVAVLLGSFLFIYYY